MAVVMVRPETEGLTLAYAEAVDWKIKTKLAEVMRFASESERLSGRMERDMPISEASSGGKSGRDPPSAP